MVPPLPAALKPSGRLDHAPEQHRLDLSVSEWPTKAARSQIRTVLGGRADPATVDDMVLVVDELVANALRHTPGVGVFLLEVDQDRAMVTVRVFDAGANCAAVAIKSAEKSDENGRGLGIVARLTEEWFAEPTTAGGKAVVAVFAIALQENSSR
jgi:anti-sigma regulatory factor (Ser/Thr protein kinase)